MFSTYMILQDTIKTSSSHSVNQFCYEPSLVEINFIRSTILNLFFGGESYADSSCFLSFSQVFEAIRKTFDRLQKFLFFFLLKV